MNRVVMTFGVERRKYFGGAALAAGLTILWGCIMVPISFNVNPALGIVITFATLIWLAANLRWILYPFKVAYDTGSGKIYYYTILGERHFGQINDIHSICFVRSGWFGIFTAPFLISGETCSIRLIAPPSSAMHSWAQMIAAEAEHIGHFISIDIPDAWDSDRIKRPYFIFTKSKP